MCKCNLCMCIWPVHQQNHVCLVSVACPDLIFFRGDALRQLRHLAYSLHWTLWFTLRSSVTEHPTIFVALQISDVIKDHPAFAKDLDWSARPGTKTYPRWKDALIGCFKVALLSSFICWILRWGLCKDPRAEGSTPLLQARRRLIMTCAACFNEARPDMPPGTSDACRDES